MQIISPAFAKPFRPPQKTPLQKPKHSLILQQNKGQISLPLEGKQGEKIYSLTLSAEDPRVFGAKGKLMIRVTSSQQVLTQKVLHLADPDFYVLLNPGSTHYITLQWQGQSLSFPLPLKIDFHPLKTSETPNGVFLEVEPNNNWKTANPVPLGKLIIGLADDRPYYIGPGEEEKASLEAGGDWFRFDQPGPGAKLVYFNVEVIDRDVPINLLVYTLKEGKIVPYEEGMDPISPPHESQAMNANKFTTRVLKPGTYYVKVNANHPAYRLRTLVYNPPPYKDPRQAVRVAMDYLIAAGDSWFANTPRSGAILRRERMVHAETVVCVACHPSHFATRGELTAWKNGYPINQKEALKFLADRLYNNPRPFYGHPEATWVRVISAAATVQSRMGTMLTDYEALTGEHRRLFFEGIVNHLKLYFKGRKEIPPDETEQNPPSISNFETTLMAWENFHRLYRLTGKKEYQVYRDQIERLIAQAAKDPKTIKNVDDLAFQTVALVTINKKKYASFIQANVEKMFALQRPSGQWAYGLEPQAPEAEFQTAECLWALALAGVKASDPRMQKAIQYLLDHQKPFGAWNTDGQPYEAFNTPFKESQFALMALSTLYPGPGTKGWTNGQQPQRLRQDNVNHLLMDLINLWDPVSSRSKTGASLLKQLHQSAQHPEPIVRSEAAAALGRLADTTAVPLLLRLLNDPSKVVQRNAAFALREIAVRKGTGFNAIEKALTSPSIRVKRAGLRIFNQHFRFLTSNPRLLNQLLTLVREEKDPIGRMMAVQPLHQWWYWNADYTLRGKILDTLLELLGEEKAHPWVLASAKESLYNITDEDIQYVYNFWVPLLAQEVDRRKAIAGFEAVMKLQAQKIAQALDKASPLQKRQILEGLTEYPIVRAWNPADQISRNFLRIGNDLDAIDFRGPSAEILRPRLLKLLQDPDPRIRQRALVLTSYLRSNGGQPSLANAIVARLEDPNPTVFQLAKQAHQIYPYDTKKTASFGLDPRRFADETNPHYNPQTFLLLSRLISSPRLETQKEALRIAAELGERLNRVPPIVQQALRLAQSEDPEARVSAFETAYWLPSLRAHPQFQEVLRKSLENTPPAVRISALRLVLEKEDLWAEETLRKSAEALLHSKKPEDIQAVLQLARNHPSLREDLRLIETYTNALSNAENLRTLALDLLRQAKKIATNPALRLAMQSLLQSANVRHRQLAEQILQGYQGRRGNPEQLLDFEYFAVRIQPLLLAKGADGRSCFDCHSNHTILNLQPPDSTGQFPQEVTRNNYRSALRVVDLENPENSLILRKPRSPGVISPETGVSHVGGPRWASKDHPAYQAILDWLNGAKVKQGEALGKPPLPTEGPP